jgi:hypothetical protein
MEEAVPCIQTTTNSITPAIYTKQMQVLTAKKEENPITEEGEHLTIFTNASVHQQDAAYAWVIAGSGGTITKP